jgi:hypothetical protein
MRRRPPWARDARRDCHGESSDNDEDSDGDNDDHDDGAQKPIQTKCGQRAGDRIAPQHMKHDSDDAPSDFGSQSSPDYDLGAGDQLCQSLLQPVPPSGPKPLRLARRLSLMKK